MKSETVSTQPLISVIIPVYNAEEYLQRCLDSVFNNKYKNLEIICVDDGSQDRSLEVLKAQTDPRIIVVEKENGGVSSARNVGLKKANGEYIAFIDSDDWVHDRYFEFLSQLLKDNVDIAQCGYAYANQDENDSDSEDYKNQIISSTEAIKKHEIRTKVWGKLFRKSILSGIWFDESVSMMEDKLFCTQVLCRSGYIAFSTAKMYYYRPRKESLSNSILTGQNLLQAGQAFLRLGMENENAVYIEEAYKALLAHRYINMFDMNAFENRKQSDYYLKCCGKKGRRVLPFGKRIIYKMMYQFPFLYRSFRIVQDKTMLDWEKQKKNSSDT